jgi:hypothetical protein
MVQVIECLPSKHEALSSQVELTTCERLFGYSGGLLPTFSSKYPEGGWKRLGCCMLLVSMILREERTGPIGRCAIPSTESLDTLVFVPLVQIHSSQQANNGKHWRQIQLIQRLKSLL